MIADLVIANLLRIAREDLEGASALAPLGNRNAVYLCEQAAEKIGVRHQLDEMVSLVPDENPLKPALRSIEQLAAYATAYRYPTPSGRIQNAPTGKELAGLIERVDTALREAVRRFEVELDEKGTPAAKPGPIR